MLGPRKTLNRLVWLEPRPPFFGVTLFPCVSSQSCELILFYCRYAVVGIWTMWRGIEGWVCLRNLGLGAIERELDGWFSSPQPQKSIGKGIQDLRDYEAHKGLIPGVGCVWVS